MGFDDLLVEILGHGNFAASTFQEIPMSTFHRVSTIVALALAGLALGPAQAIADESGRSTLIKRVTFSDLNLRNEAGARVLYRRIKTAAEDVCAPFNGRQLVQRMNQTACVTSAMERAVRQVNEPVLTRYYLTRNPKSDLDTSLAAAP